MISTSEIAVSCVIEDKYTELAVRALHDAFELGARRAALSAWPTTARAAVFFGPGKPFEIREVPIPEVEPEGVLIRVSARQHLRLRPALLARRRAAALSRRRVDLRPRDDRAGRAARRAASRPTRSAARSPRATASPTRTSIRAAAATRASTRSPRRARTRSSGRSARAPSRTCTAPSPTTTTSARAAISSRCPTRCPTRRWRP